MANIVKSTVDYRHSFDPVSKRHQINGIQSVLHCHHYTALYTQLAIDAGETDTLKNCARSSFRKMLSNYLDDHPGISDLHEILEVFSQYYSLLGLGKMQIDFAGSCSGKVTVPVSHVSSGWMKKWGKFSKPVDYISAGFIEAVFETAFETPENTFIAEEVKSIVMGAENSVFKIVRRK